MHKKEGRRAVREKKKGREACEGVRRLFCVRTQLWGHGKERTRASACKGSVLGRTENGETDCQCVQSVDAVKNRKKNKQTNKRTPRGGVPGSLGDPHVLEGKDSGPVCQYHHHTACLLPSRRMHPREAAVLTRWPIQRAPEALDPRSSCLEGPPWGAMRQTHHVERQEGVKTKRNTHTQPERKRKGGDNMQQGT